MPAASTVLFGRWARLTIDTIQITSAPGRAALAFGFSVQKTLKPQPNKAEITIRNLNPDHRMQLEKLGEVPVKIEAGYGEEGEAASMLFLGNLRSAHTLREGPDLVTSIGSGDGEAKARSSRVSVSVAKNTPTESVFRQVALSVGVSPGNLDQAASLIASKFGAGGLFPSGGAIFGNAHRELAALCRSADLDYTIHEGKLLFVERGKTLAGTAILLGGAANGGLVGEPSVDSKGVLSCKMMMQPDVYPGRAIVLQGARVKGQFRIEETSHAGDTMGGEWSIDVKGKRY